jgi:hypothetical protein
MKRKDRKQTKHKPVELGAGGIVFEQRGQEMLPAQSTSTQSGVAASLTYLGRESYFIASAVKNGASPEELSEQFRETAFGKVASPADWKEIVEDFVPDNPNRGRPKSWALAWLARKMTLTVSTLKTLASREKRRVRNKSTISNSSQP